MTTPTRLEPNLNAFTVNFADTLLDEIRSSYLKEIDPRLTATQDRKILQGGERFHQPFGSLLSGYYLTSYDTRPLLWFSNNDAETYQMYKRFFDSLAISETIKERVSFNSEIIMYCGFLVISDHAPDFSWHVDYQPESNAYTLITPLFKPDPAHGSLLYKDAKDQISTYPYTLNEAVFFGEGFVHTTEPYERSNEIRVLVSLTFGTDQIEHWPILKNTISTQSKYYILPCGHPVGSCQCMENLS